MRWAVVASPIGPVAVGVDGTGVAAVQLRPRHAAPPVPASGLLAEAASQLRAYFAGERTKFALPLSVPDSAGSDFERAVWAVLARIPYGEMRTYGEVAAEVGDAGAARAVGTACNHNPVALIVPCHRVVGAGGKLVGFGGGLPRKRWLLEHEARVAMQAAWS
jgi:methylated-DNA-[protein]-cysteine S-methyltransferase